MRRIVSVLAFAMAMPLFANEVDRNFVDGMIMHHRHGIMMSELAERKGESDDLRALARKMIEEQKKDIADLEKMRAEGENPQRPELADMPGMMGMNMKWLEAKSGPDFDRSFAIAMIDHHLGGIKMANHETSRGGMRAPKAKAREIARKQRGEIRELARHK